MHRASSLSNILESHIINAQQLAMQRATKLLGCRPCPFIQILPRFYLDFIQILSRFKKKTLSKFYPDFTLIFEEIWIKLEKMIYSGFIQILSYFYPDFLETHFIQILSRFYSDSFKT